MNNNAIIKSPGVNQYFSDNYTLFYNISHNSIIDNSSCLITSKYLKEYQNLDNY
jgi:hypothetical protein